MLHPVRCTLIGVSCTVAACCLLVWSNLSLATSHSLPGQLQAHAAEPRAEGGEGLANIALDHVSLECQLHVQCTCEPVKFQLELRMSSVPLEASRLARV